MLKTLTAEAFNSGTVPFKETAQTLLANGFTPIPLVDGQKFPNIRGWQKTSGEDVPGLIESHGNTRSTGLLLGVPDDSGYSLVAIDYDIYDGGLAKDLRQDSMVQRGGPIRIGQAPKFLQLFKTRDPRLRRKRQSPIYIDNAGRKNRIEILAERQQCVVSGIHPGTGQPYRWQNQDGTPAPGPFGTSMTDLPEIDAEWVDVLFSMMEVYAVMLRDMAVEGGSSTTPDSGPPAGELTEEEEADRLLYLAGKRRGITIDEAEKDLRWVLANNYHTWIDVGMGLKFEFQGSPEAMELYDRWSATAPNYAGRAGVEAKWRSFEELPLDRDPVTWGTVTRLKAEAIRNSDVGPDVTAEELAEAQKRLEPRGPRRKGFHLIALGEFIRDIRPPKYLVEGVIEEGTMGVVFGDPGTYKTFVTMDMLLCVASGRPWHGHAVKQGPVVYIVGEGRQGIARRVLAWGKHNGVDVATLPFFVSSMSAALTDPKAAAEVAATIAEVTEKHGAPVAVCIDTLARNFGSGDENSTADMSAFVTNIDQYLGSSCVRLIVHHSGLNDKTRSRGNSALKGALDFEYRMKKRVDGIVEMKNTKMKDAPEWTEPMRFIPHTVSIGDFDNPIESIVLETYAPGPQEAIAGSAKMREAVDLLRELCDLQREDLKAGGHDPNGARVTKGEWRDACVERRIYTRPATYDMMPAAARRGLIEMDGDYVYPKVSEVSECCQN